MGLCQFFCDIFLPYFSKILGLDPYSAQSCDVGQLTCHGSATCEDNVNGFCCKCINGWYGDGTSCLPKGIHNRLPLIKCLKLDINLLCITLLSMWFFKIINLFIFLCNSILIKAKELWKRYLDGVRFEPAISWLVMCAYLLWIPLWT